MLNLKEIVILAKVKWFMDAKLITLFTSAKVVLSQCIFLKYTVFLQKWKFKHILAAECIVSFSCSLTYQRPLYVTYATH